MKIKLTKLITMYRSSLLKNQKIWCYWEEKVNTFNKKKHLKDDIINTQKLTENILENNIKLDDHQFYHVPVQYIQGSQSGPINRSRSLTDRKYKSVDSNRTNSLPVKLS